MARGGGARGGNNGGSHNNGGRTGGNNENSFSSLDHGDRFSTENINSAFYLSNADHPGLSLVSTPLLGPNYNSWHRAMSMALIAKNKIGFVDRSISRPEDDDSLLSFWFRCNNMVMSWILNAVSKDIADSIMYVNNACDMWTDLHERFHQSNGPRIFQLKQQIHALVQGSNDVSSYFTKLKTLWDELSDFRPFPACHCGGMKDLVAYQHQDYVLQFLMGLNESFSQIRAQILMIEPLPSINKIFSLVIQEERQRSLNSCSVLPLSATYGVNSSNYNVSKGRRVKPVCTYCGYYGHTVDKCYKKHGYPPGFTPKSQSPSYSKEGGPNRWSNKWSSGNSKATVAQANVLADSAGSTTSSLNSLSANQCQELISLLSTQLQDISSSSYSSVSADQQQQQPIVSNCTGQYAGPADWDE
ncbi:hypothetical protein UlMin_021617 [Ulmus minor]